MNHDKNYLILFLSFPVALCAQTYQQLSEKAIEYIEMDSLSKAEELLLQALKLEPKNAKNAMLFPIWDWCSVGWVNMTRHSNLILLR